MSVVTAVHRLRSNCCDVSKTPTRCMPEKGTAGWVRRGAARTSGAHPSGIWLWTIVVGVQLICQFGSQISPQLSPLTITAWLSWTTLQATILRSFPNN